MKLEEKSNQELLEYIESLQSHIPLAIRNILDPEAASRQVEEVRAKRSEANCASRPGLVAPKPSRRICGKRQFAECTFHILDSELGATRKSRRIRGKQTQADSCIVDEHDEKLLRILNQIPETAKDGQDFVESQALSSRPLSSNVARTEVHEPPPAQVQIQVLLDDRIAAAVKASTHDEANLSHGFLKAQERSIPAPMHFPIARRNEGRRRRRKKMELRRRRDTPFKAKPTLPAMRFSLASQQLLRLQAYRRSLGTRSRQIRRKHNPLSQIHGYMDHQQACPVNPPKDKLIPGPQVTFLGRVNEANCERNWKIPEDRSHLQAMRLLHQRARVMMLLLRSVHPLNTRSYHLPR